MKSRIGTNVSPYIAEIPVASTESWSARAQCGNPDCSARWLSVWKDRRRPVFEGRWSCSRGCLGKLVAAVLRREATDSDISQREHIHQHRVPLGLFMMDLGWITELQRSHALAMQRQHKTGQIGHWLVTACGVDPRVVTRALAMQWGCPRMTTDGFDCRTMALVLPQLLLHPRGIIPIRIVQGRSVHVAFANRPDASLAFAIGRMTGLDVIQGIIDSGEWEEARRRLLDSEAIHAQLNHLASLARIGIEVTSTLVGLQPRASRLVRVHDVYWLRMWLEEGAMSRREGGVPTGTEDVVDRLYMIGSPQ